MDSSQKKFTIILASIGQHEVFSSLHIEHQEQLARHARLILASDGEFIFRQGELGRDVYAVCDGTVRIFRIAPDGREILVKSMQKGEIFGEVAAFEGKAYPAHAQVLGQARLLAIPALALQDLMVSTSFRYDFIKVLMTKLSFLSSQVHALSAYDVEQRFFYFLSTTYGKLEQYTLDMPKKDLALAIGTVPETLSRLLKRLSQRGIITWEEDRLTVSAKVWSELDL